ncbi:MAG: ATP-binding protein [Erysipelotrichaceae bacterium]|nr:ATP-binding protein [Erysipelotrichaceae bacterium]
MALTITFIGSTLKSSYIKDKNISLLTQINILSNQVAPNIFGIQKENTRTYLQELIKGYSLDINARLLLLDMKGIVLIDSYDEKINEDLGQLADVSAAIEGFDSHHVYNLPSGESVIYVSVPITDRNEIIGVLLASASIRDLLDSVTSTMRQIAILSGLGLLFTGLVAFVFAQVIASPIEKMIQLVQAFSRGNFGVKINREVNDEIGQLADAFNDMSTKINQVDEQRRKFVSNVSHELRTPLTSLKIISETLLQQPTWSEDVYREFLGDIDSEVIRLNRIVDSLLYLVDLEREELVLEVQITYLNYIVQKVVKNLKPLAEQKHIQIEIEDKDRIQFYVDQGKLQQCLINLVSNAIKYTPENGHIKIAVFRENALACISIEDTGIGIPFKDLQHVFDRFYRVDRARARTTGGSGLGLAIAKQIVSLHGGSISVESTQNVGTTFTVKLPVRSLGVI